MELEDVFRAHQQAVFAYFLRLVGNRHDAEELTQGRSSGHAGRPSGSAVTPRSRRGSSGSPGACSWGRPGPGSSSALSGAGSGTVVAANVYRSSGFVAGYGAALLAFFASLVLTTVGDPGFMALVWAVFIPNIACAAFVACHRWAKRPAVLRSPA